MSWQEDLKQLDDQLSSGSISIEEHRKRRDDLLASASSAASATVTHSPADTEQATAAPPQVPVEPHQPHQSEPVGAGGTVGSEKARDEAGTGEPGPNETELSDVQPADRPAQQTQQVPAEQEAERTATMSAADIAAAGSAETAATPADTAPADATRADAAGAAAPPADPDSTQRVADIPGIAGTQHVAAPEPERTQWVTQNPGQQPENQQPENQPTQSQPHPGQAAAPAPWQQSVPKFPPRPEPFSPAQQPGPYGQPGGPPPFPPHQGRPPHGLTQVPFPGPSQGPQQGPPPGLPPAPGSAGEGWQPQWQRDWEPAPGGGRFDAFNPDQPPPNRDPFEQGGKKPSNRTKILVSSLVAVLVLGLAGFGVWWFLLRDSGTGDTGQSQALPTDINGMLARIPQLPGQPNNEIGPTIPTSVGADERLYPVRTAEALIGQGTENVVYKASVDGGLQYGVLAVPSERPGEVSDAILKQQTDSGWQRSTVPGTPEGGTGLKSTKDGVTFQRVLYDAGKWTIFIGVSPEQSGNDGQVGEDFGAVVRSVSKALPPS